MEWRPPRSRLRPGAGPRRPSGVLKPQLSLIVPAYNEEGVIERTLDEYIRWLDAWGRPYELLVVLNGCRDRTLERVLAVQARHPQVGWGLLPEPSKGRAVKLGFLLARGCWVGFVDADGQIPPEEFAKLVAALERAEARTAGAIACRSGRKRQWLRRGEEGAGEPWVRRLSGQAFSTLVRGLTGLPLRDTQCGAKLFRHEALRPVLPELQGHDWTFDVELLWALYRRGWTVIEVPIVVRPETRPSRVHLLHAAPQVLLELGGVRWRTLAQTRRRNGQSRPRLGELLCALGKTHPEDIQRALQLQQRWSAQATSHPRLGELLVQLELVSPEDVRLALALQAL